MKTRWLLRQDEVLTKVELADSLLTRSLGLLGRQSLDGAMLLTHTRSVHSLFMRFPLDVAFLDSDLVVIATTLLEPWRVALPPKRARSVLEAHSGSFDRWGIVDGDRLTLAEMPGEIR